MHVAAPLISASSLIAAYDGFLLDAYGVLLDKTGPLPGAVRFVERLEAAGKPYLILTNSASRLPESLAVEMGAMGFSTDADRILTSGTLLGPFFLEQGLGGADSLVLGTEESSEYVRRAGGRPVPWFGGREAEVVVVADQQGVTMEVMDWTLTLLVRRFDKGKPVSVVLCNPDLIYPVAPGRYGFTAGGLAALLEAVIRERYPGVATPVVRLGKPYSPIFEEANRRLGVATLVMVGDQLATDVLGANRAGIDSVLVSTGLSGNVASATDGPRPTWMLSSLASA
jgi:HAD superfamily hydrolase (TIGR01450 family)